MASVSSLGIHKPSALPFLVTEGILPADPPESAFTWQTVDGDDHGEEEELLSTRSCVVWSRGGIISRVFRFDVEAEPVIGAVFTHFPSQASRGSETRENLHGSIPRDSRNQRTDSELKVGKQRTFNSESRSNNKSAEHLKTDSKRDTQGSWDTRKDHHPGKSRALVVVLKTQAQVFFLSETSHVVHLPFEVEAVFPSDPGVLLLRKLPDKIPVPPSPQLPSAPNNSFAFSQTILSPVPDSQLLPSLVHGEDQSSPFLPLLQDLLQRSTSVPEAGLPRLFCLTDPLTEIGTIATKCGPNLGRPNQRKQGRPTFGNLDSKESLLYISSRDELPQRTVNSIEKSPLLLAVTENRDDNNFTVWKVAYADHGALKNLHRQTSPIASGTTSRRRSSFAPGMGTGATTPTVKGSTGGRDSFGVGLSYHHSSIEGEISDQDAEDFLGSTFGISNVPAKASRRVSGLLARSDLSTNQDRNAFSDFAGVLSGNKGGRKGTSFGAHGARLSAGLDAGVHTTKPQTLHGIRDSFDSVSLQDNPLGEGVDDHDDIYNLFSLGDRSSDDTIRGLRKEVLFSKVYSMPNEARKLQHPQSRGGIPSHDIITMKAPKSSLGDISNDETIIMCLIDRLAQELLVLHITAKPMDNGGYKTSVTGITRQSGIVDACKIGDDGCSRIMVLEPTADGPGKLSLHAPWSSVHHIELPATLSIYNPYQIASDISLRHRREGSFKRILSQGPSTLVALNHSCNQGRVNVVDSAGMSHRLQIQFGPRNSLVRDVIKISESVLPTSAAEGECILRGWWEVMSWLQTRNEEEVDIEWSAIIVVLFSLGVAFMEDPRNEATTRQRRRKGGLLRSSSGANTDLESWETMIRQEGSFSGTSPAWIQREAWNWTLEESTLPQASPLNTSRSSQTKIMSRMAAVPIPKKSPYLMRCISLAREFVTSPGGRLANGDQGYLPTASSKKNHFRRTALASILVGLHLFREELKLNVLAMEALHRLTPVLAQIGTWLGWEAWSHNGFYRMENADMDDWLFEDTRISGIRVPPEPFQPPSILKFIEATNLISEPTPFVSLLDAVISAETGHSRRSTEACESLLLELTPRTIVITNLLSSHYVETMEVRVAKLASWGLKLSLLETLPESVSLSFRTAMSLCQARPSTLWDTSILQIIGREDIAMIEWERGIMKPQRKSLNSTQIDVVRDVHSICNAALEVETVGPYDGSADLDRQSVTRMLFKDDQRFAEAAKLLHPLQYPIAQCTPEPEWSETELLEAQQELVKLVVLRTMSVSLGRGLLFFDARLPLLTEKFPIHAFTLSCVMKPSESTVSADRNSYTEDKVAWAFFHAGTEAGLSISRDAQGIDTSWILFNKPRELSIRHAGFLLALGLNGHLKTIAKWVAFKYLTPKHTMTSIGLLLGLSASYLGTMDSLITRLLSVHVTRMLPPGAAELNLSPLTQTSGIMGIGLLYCNTQHRRMSEIMLSEMENVDQEDFANPLEGLRDEGYRLAAGFALGYINLGQGKNLKGLYDMHITERLLVLAIGTRKVSLVHILDKATAAATIAVALIYMKTQDKVLAQKIDIPDTLHQFDYVRPDMFLLRTVARHLIMWDNILATFKWIKMQLPSSLQHRFKLTTVRTLTSGDLPLLNIIAGVCLAIGLRFAGSGSARVRNVLTHYLDQFIRICRLPALNHDGKMARITVRNCQDTIALSVSCVMAGTGDLVVFRRLRSLHGRTDADTPYGSHLATHFAVGILFMGGGTHTFGTSNLAVASLLCSFYPLFPSSVLDNKSHLQAFRHFWVLASERRCLIARDVDTHRPVPVPIVVVLRTGAELTMSAPCLLPELGTVSTIRTNDSEYWTVTLDLAENPEHYRAFMRHQSIYVRHRSAYDAYAYTSVFGATMQALNDVQFIQQVAQHAFRWLFTLPTFEGFDRAEQALVLPADPGSLIYQGTRGTVLDDRLVLERACMGSSRSERLWNLRILFAWAEGAKKRGEELGWLSREVVEGLKAALAVKKWEVKQRL